MRARVHLCPSNTVPNNLSLPPPLVFYQWALSNRYSHLCLCANTLFPSSLFPPPQRDKVKECCASASKLHSTMLSECSSEPPAPLPLPTDRPTDRRTDMTLFLSFAGRERRFSLRLCRFAPIQSDLEPGWRYGSAPTPPLAAALQLAVKPLGGHGCFFVLIRRFSVGC